MMNKSGIRSSPFVLVLLVCAAGICSGEIIPSNRRVDWNPGIPGGIPVRTKIFADVKTAYGAYGDGSHDDSAALQNAMNACPAGQVLQIPAGTYRITSQLTIAKGIVLRGDGPSLSKIALDNSSASRIIQIGDISGNITGIPVTGGSIKGSNRITVSDASRFSVGDMIIIDIRDDGSLIQNGYRGYCSQFKRRDGGGDWRSIGQVLEITAKSGDTLEIRSPLHWNFSSRFSPEVYPANGTVVKYAGLEDIQLFRTSPYNGNGNIILMRWAAYCWVKNVECRRVAGRHIQLQRSYKCVVRDSFCHDAWNYDKGGTAYGICLDEYTTDCLVENNIVFHLNNPMTFENSGGGNVFGYNYADDAVLASAPDWMLSDIGTHCTWPHMELVEGNRCGMICSDNVWGGGGYVTLFRNHVKGRHFSRTEKANVSGFDIEAHNWFFNIVGNVLLEPGVDAVYELYDAPDCSPKAAYRLGYVRGCSPTDATTYSTLLRHGNFDYVTNETKWDAGILDHLIPASLYLHSKPAFFGTKPWPIIGPDVIPMTGMIPAEERFLAIGDGSKSGL